MQPFDARRFVRSATEFLDAEVSGDAADIRFFARGLWVLHDGRFQTVGQLYLRIAAHEPIRSTSDQWDRDIALACWRESQRMKDRVAARALLAIVRWDAGEMLGPAAQQASLRSAA